MKFDDVKVHSVFEEDFSVEKCISDKSTWDYEIIFGIDTGSRANQYLFSVCIDLIRVTNRHRAKIKVYTQYLVVTDTANFAPLNDYDYYTYADLIKTAFDHARVIIEENFEGTPVQGQFLRVIPIQKFFLDLKEGGITLTK